MKGQCGCCAAPVAASKDKVLEQIHNEWLIPVIRAESAAEAEKIVDALLAGGVKIVEITFSCPDAPGIIRKLVSRNIPGLLVGAGTVLSKEDAARAIDAGAAFVLAPNTNPEVVAEAKKRGVPVMPGAFTPTEIEYAHRLGADAVKVFPAEFFGAKYLKTLAGPMPHVKIIPTGGVSLENLKEWRDAKAFAVGVGGNLVDKAAIKKGEFAKITETAKKFVEAIRQVKAQK